VRVERERAFERRAETGLVPALDREPLPAPGFSLMAMTVSARPPVRLAIGRVPYRRASIWPRPHGSYRDGMRKKSAPA